MVFDKTTPQVGFVDLSINLAAMPWLQGTWSSSGTAWAQNPSARVSFGSARTPFIYLRERY